MKRLLLLSGILMSFSALANHQPLDKAIEAVKPQVIEWRRQVHQYPELSNREVKTAAFITQKLRSFGIETKTGIAKTGVVGILKGAKPGPTIGLRADIDGLPVKERVDLPFASKETMDYLGQKVPVMHACGHDSHVAILLGTAKVLSQRKEELAGTVVFIFQPAEEGAPKGEVGGAPQMIKEGVLDNPRIDALFGLHISSGLETGKILYKSGAFQASADSFYITVKGKQTHGAMPWLGVDPIVVGAQIVTALQTIVSRQEDLSKAPVVITVGKLHAGVRENIIPEELTMSGTIRMLDSQMQKDVHERIKHTVLKIAEASNAKAQVEIIPQTLVNYNDPELTALALPSLQRAAGKENVHETPWVMPAEDFSFYSAKIPTLFFGLGGMPKGTDPKLAPPHHTPDFYIDDSGLDLGVKAFCQLVLDYPQIVSKKGKVV